MKRLFLTLLALVLMSVSAHAAITHHDSAYPFDQVIKIISDGADAPDLFAGESLPVLQTDESEILVAGRSFRDLLGAKLRRNDRSYRYDDDDRDDDDRVKVRLGAANRSFEISGAVQKITKKRIWISGKKIHTKKATWVDKHGQQCQK